MADVVRSHQPTTAPATAARPQIAVAFAQTETVHASPPIARPASIFKRREVGGVLDKPAAPPPGRSMPTVPMGDRVIPLSGPPRHLPGIGHPTLTQALATGNTQVGRRLGAGVSSTAYTIEAAGSSTGYVFLHQRNTPVDQIAAAVSHHHAVEAALGPGVLPTHGGVAVTERTRLHGQLLQAVDGTGETIAVAPRHKDSGLPQLQDRSLNGQDLAALGHLLGRAYQRMADAKVAYADHKNPNWGYQLAAGERPAVAFPAKTGGTYNAPFSAVMILDVGSAKPPEYLSSSVPADRVLTPNSVPKMIAEQVFDSSDARMKRAQSDPRAYSQALANNLYHIITGVHPQEGLFQEELRRDPTLEADRQQQAVRVMLLRARGSYEHDVAELKKREEAGHLPAGFATAFDKAWAGKSTPREFSNELLTAAGLQSPDRPEMPQPKSFFGRITALATNPFGR